MSNTASYIGKEPTYGVFITQTETGDGSTVAFSLDATAATPSSLLVSVGGIVQQPASAFNINSAGTTLTFTAAPGSSIPIWILFLGQTLVVPQASSANTTMITGETALTSLAATDDFLVYDADASALKKVNYQYVHSGVADMAANTVKVRDANTTGAPSDKAVATTEILIGDGTGFTAAALSSDVTMTNAGAVTIAADAVTPAKINILDDALAATDTHYLIADGTDYSSFVLSGDVTSSNAGAVTIANDAINNAKMADNAVDTAELADNAVGLAEMAGLARGKIIYGDASGDPAALTVGSNGQSLISDGTDISWGAGGITWQAVVTTGTTMVAGRGYFVNTTGSAFSMTLPASASLGDEVHVIDYAGTFDTNNCTVARNSHKIIGATSDLVVATERAAFKLVYVDATQGWLLTEL